MLARPHDNCRTWRQLYCASGGGACSGRSSGTRPLAAAKQPLPSSPIALARLPAVQQGTQLTVAVVVLLLVVVADQAAAGDGRDEREREKVLETQVNESCCSRREEREREKERITSITHLQEMHRGRSCCWWWCCPQWQLLLRYFLSPDSFGVDALSLLL